MIEALCRDAGRDRGELRLAVALKQPQQADVSALAALGIDELVVVEAPPGEAADVPDWVAGLADRWVRS
jgi:hypothetical protein